MNRHPYRADRVYSHAPEFVGKCWICKAPIRAGNVAYVRDHFAALRTGNAPARKCHKGQCADRARRMVDRMAPNLFNPEGWGI